MTMQVTMQSVLTGYRFEINGNRDVFAITQIGQQPKKVARDILYIDNCIIEAMFNYEFITYLHTYYSF